MPGLGLCIRDVFGAEVGEFAAFEIGPEPFGWVELRCVPGEQDNLDAMGGQDGLYDFTPMGLEAVPDSGSPSFQPALGPIAGTSEGCRAGGRPSR